MQQTLSILPSGFWVATILLLGGIAWAVTRLRQSIGIPMITVLLTVAVWYLGDVLYNDYATAYTQIFSSKTLENAWWQVVCFLAVFLIVAPSIHGALNGRGAQRTSQVLHLMNRGTAQPRFQKELCVLLVGCYVVWVPLAIFAFWRFKDDVVYYFF